MERSATERLASIVRARRKELGLGQDLSDRDGPSAATVRLIESGHPPSLQRGTKAGLEAALEWWPGSIDAVLRGDDPLLMPARADRPSSAGVLVELSSQALIAYETASILVRERARSVAAAAILEVLSNSAQPPHLELVAPPEDTPRN